MATVIRNPVLLHYLQQFGVTPEDHRRIEKQDSLEPSLTVATASLVDYLANVLNNQTPPPPTDG